MIPVSKPGTLLQIARTFGARDGLLRLGYEVKRGSGWLLRRMQSVQGWDRWNLENIAPGVSAEEFLHVRRAGERPFFFQDSRTLGPGLRGILGSGGEQSICAQAQDILAGNFPFFGRLSFNCGF